MLGLINHSCEDRLFKRIFRANRLKSRARQAARPFDPKRGKGGQAFVEPIACTRSSSRRGLAVLGAGRCHPGFTFARRGAVLRETPGSAEGLFQPAAAFPGTATNPNRAGTSARAMG